MDGLYQTYLRQVDSQEGTCFLGNYPPHCSALFLIYFEERVCMLTKIYRQVARQLLGTIQFFRLRVFSTRSSITAPISQRGGGYLLCHKECTYLALLLAGHRKVGGSYTPLCTSCKTTGLRVEVYQSFPTALSDDAKTRVCSQQQYSIIFEKRQLLFLPSPLPASPLLVAAITVGITVPTCALLSYLKSKLASQLIH